VDAACAPAILGKAARALAAARKGNRVRLEIVKGDSVITDVLWTHYYLPNKIGTDTIYHSAEHPSALTLPVMEGADFPSP
jgi:hypothetical protein